MDPTPDLATLSASSGPAALLALLDLAVKGTAHPAVAAPACGAELVP